MKLFKRIRKLSFKILTYIFMCSVCVFIAGWGPQAPTASLENGGKFRLGFDKKKQAMSLAMLQGLPDSFNCDPKDNPTRNEMVCMVCNCYHEARGESPEGQIAVARVVYTREISKFHPNSICGVIYAPSQFSWTLEPLLRNAVIGPQRDGFNGCVESTKASLSYRGQWFASNYFNPYVVSPGWRSACRGPKQIGNHLFFTGGCDADTPSNLPTGNSDRVEGVSKIILDWLWPQSFAQDKNPSQEFLKSNSGFQLKTSFTEKVKRLIGSERSPAEIKGDFNGDGRLDYVSLMYKGEDHYMVFFISDQNKFKIKYKQVSGLDTVYLTLVPKNKIKSNFPDKKKRDLVQLETYLGVTTGYFVYGNKVVAFKGVLEF